MFQFTWFASYSYELAIGYLAVGFPIRISTSHKIFAPLRSFSQLVTSFIASWCLGILLVLFLTWPLLINISVYFQFNCLFKKFWLVFKLLWFKSLLRFFQPSCFTRVGLVEIRRFELLTSCLQGRRSPNWAIPPYIIKIVWRFFSLERRWSSRTFRYGYLVTTSPQSLILPSTAATLRFAHRLRVLQAPMVWRAVCTRPGNAFTAAFWSAITSNSIFMYSSCRVQSELRKAFWGLLNITILLPFVPSIVARV